MLRLTKRKFVLGAATVCVMAIAAGAYAYFTNTGSGTATATVGSGSAVTLKATLSGSLYPGTKSTVNFTVENPSPAKQRIGTISVTKVEADAGHSECKVTYGSATTNAFYMPPVVANQVVPGSASTAITTTGELEMRNLEESQNNCQGANLTLTLKSE